MKNIENPTRISALVFYKLAHFLFTPVTKLICAKPTCKWIVSYIVFLQIMYADLRIFDTEAKINLVKNALLLPEWNHRIYREKMLNLEIATRQLLHMDGNIWIRVRFSSQCVLVWFGIVLNLADDMLPGTSFIDRIIRNIFQSEQKLVPRHFHPVATSVLFSPLPIRARAKLQSKQRQLQYARHIKPFYNLTLSDVWRLPHQPLVFASLIPGYWRELVNWRSPPMAWSI